MTRWVDVVAPAGPVDPVRLEAGLARLRGWGFEIREGAALRKVHGHLAGRDHERAADLDAALTRGPETTVWAARGGFGCARLLGRLDWKRFAAQQGAAARLVGYSDLTALQAALWTVLGRTSWHAPMVAVELAGELDPLTASWLGWALDIDELGPWPDVDAVVGPRLLVPHLDVDGPRAILPLDPRGTLVGGRAEGPLLGGNLSVLSSLAGTPWLPDFTGAVLLIEDHGEYPFRLDRHLAQLANAGVFRELAAVLIGHFPNCDEPDPAKSTFRVDELFEQYFAPLGVPVVAGLPVGHAAPRISLPIGGRVHLEA